MAFEGIQRCECRDCAPRLASALFAFLFGILQWPWHRILPKYLRRRL